jgi:hypothetical protein
MTSTSNLSIPLLGNLPREHERDEQDAADYDEEVCMILVHEDSSQQEEYQQNEQSSDHESPSSWWFANCALALVVSALLFLQFGIAFHMFPAAATAGLRWSVVNYSIVLYAIVAALYRQSVKDYDTFLSDASYSPTVLLPELLMDTMLCLILFDKVVAAFWLLQCGIVLFLAVSVAASKIRLVLIATRSTSTDDDTYIHTMTRPISSNRKTTNSPRTAQINGVKRTRLNTANRYMYMYTHQKHNHNTHHSEDAFMYLYKKWTSAL